MEEQASELRRIRIAMIFLVIVTLFSAGGSTVTVDYPNSDNKVEISQKNVVPLKDGRFGVIEYGSMKIYEYDTATNELKKVNEFYLDELDE